MEGKNNENNIISMPAQSHDENTFSHDTPQKLTVQHVIQVSQPDITMNELIQPLFNASPYCHYCHCAHFTQWGKAG